MKNQVKKQQVESRLKQALGRFLLDFHDEAVVKFINLTEVKISPDLAYAKVFYTLLASEDHQAAAAEFFKANTAKLRKRLARSLNLRITPQLNFCFDNTEEKAAYLDSLIEQALRRDSELSLS